MFLSLPLVELALQRIAAPVRQGGHDVPRRDVVRRFNRSEKNFQLLYRVLADKWTIYENSGEMPRLLEEGPLKTRRNRSKPSQFSKQVGAALRRAAAVARKTARTYGTPIYVWENGKVVAKKP